MYRILMLAVDSRLIFRDGLTALWAQYDDIRDERAGDRFCYLVPAMTGRDVQDPMALCRVPAVRLEQRGFSYCVSVHEWLEILNPTAATIDITGWRLRDNTSEDVIPTFSLGPGQYLVIAASAAGFAANHPGFSGNLVTLEGTLGNGLGNTGDRLLLLAPDGQTVDAVSYGSDTSAFTPSCPTVPAAGQSLARVPAGQDTDSAADWLAQALPNPGAAGVAPPPTATLTATVTDQPSTATVTPSATPTPSATRTPTPTATPVSTPSTAQAGAVIITEIMQNPAAVADSAGEWFEVFNTTAAAIDLNGWTLRDAGSESHRISAGGPLWLPAGGYLVLGRNADRAANGGVLLAYQYSGFTLGNDDDEIILLDGAGREVNAVAWDNGATFPDPNGASMALLRPGLDNRRGENWRASFRAWPGGAGDFGSPGAANPIPPAGRIEGYVYEDLNGDGWRDAGEPGIANVWMALADGRGTHTYSGGWYGFADLPAGTYTVTEGQPAGYISTSPDELVVYLADGQTSVGHDFGERRAAATATPTPTPTAAPGTPTVTPPPGSRPRLLLSEVLYDAVQDGTDAAWEWVEVYLAEGPAVNLAGWRLRDNVAEDVLPAFILEPGSYLVIAASAADFAANHPGYSGNLISLEDSIGNGLGNSGDVVILLAPDGTVADAMSYGNNTAAFDPACPGVGAGASLARVPSAVDGDSAADWHAQAQPNPGGPPPAPASPTPSPSATPTPTPTSMGGATPTATPSAPALTITPTPSPTPPDRFTMTPTASPAGTATPTTRPAVRLNEYLPRPQAVDWNGDGTNDAYDEYIELFNPGPAAADLTGWALDDIADGGSHPYVFPPGSQIAPGGFAVFYRSLTGVALNQDADTVRLLASDGAEVDRAAYANPRPDTSYSRMTDGAGAWTDGYPPSPGGPNRPGPATVTPTASPTPSVTSTPTAATVTATPTRTPTPTPTGTPVAASVFLNELLPDPERTDWDSDGSVTFEDEWIELVNTAATVVELGGWAIADDSKTYTLPLGSRIWPGGYLLLFRTQTHLSLGDTHDAVTLLRPDGLAADRLEYAQGPGDDRSFCRQPDATGGWTGACLPSPGAANQPWPTPQPSDVSGGGGSAARSGAPWITSIAAARAAPEGTLVTVTGAVTLPSGGFGRSIYIQEDGAGIRVYLRSGEYGALALGDRLQVTGWTDDAWGELEIAAANPGALVRLGAGAPPAPAYVATGAVGEAHEGRLIWIAGKIVKWETTAILLDDGSGPLRIYFPTDLSWHRPYVQIGETWAAQGVVGQYVAARPYVGGYRLVVRLPSDVGLPPLFLPVTGADTPIK